MKIALIVNRYKRFTPVDFFAGAGIGCAGAKDNGRGEAQTATACRFLTFGDGFRARARLRTPEVVSAILGLAGEMT